MVRRRNKRAGIVRAKVSVSAPGCACTVSAPLPTHHPPQTSSHIACAGSNCPPCLPTLAACLFHRPDVCPGPPYGQAQPRTGKGYGTAQERVTVVGKVCVCVWGLGVLPWCLAPNGIRGERQHKGDKVKLRCCQLQLTTSGPNSRGTGALSRHRSYSHLTPLFLPTLSFICNSFFSCCIVLFLPSFPTPARNAPPGLCQHAVMYQQAALHNQASIL